MKRLFFTVALLAMALTVFSNSTRVPNARADSTSTTLNLYLGGYVVYQGVRYLQAKAKIDSNVRYATSIVTTNVTNHFGINKAPADFWFAAFATTPPPAGVSIVPVTAPASDLGALRNEILYATYNWVPAASFTPTPLPLTAVTEPVPSSTPTAPARLQYETLRSCWNAMIFANVASSNANASASTVSRMYPTSSPTPTPMSTPHRGHASTRHAQTAQHTVLMGLMTLDAQQGGKVQSHSGGSQNSKNEKPKAKPSSTAKPTATAKPTPSPTPTASPPATVDTSSCVQTSAKYEPTASTWVDAIDAVNAFSAATPPLLQQIIDTNVESYADTNSLRADVNWILGAEYIHSAWAQKFNYKATHGGAAPIANLPLPQIVTDCYTKESATACAQDLGAIEAAAEKAYQNGAACAFARQYWLPTYTAVRRASPPPLDGPPPSYGPAPGCSS